MRVAVMAAPGEVRVEDYAEPDHRETDRCGHRAVGDLRLRIGPVALPRDRTTQRAAADGVTKYCRVR